MSDEKKNKPPLEKEPVKDKPNPYPVRDVNSIETLPEPFAEDK